MKDFESLVKDNDGFKRVNPSEFEIFKNKLNENIETIEIERTQNIKAYILDGKIIAKEISERILETPYSLTMSFYNYIKENYEITKEDNAIITDEEEYLPF